MEKSKKLARVSADLSKGSARELGQQVVVFKEKGTFDLDKYGFQ